MNRLFFKILLVAGFQILPFAGVVLHAQDTIWFKYDKNSNKVAITFDTKNDWYFKVEDDFTRNLKNAMGTEVMNRPVQLKTGSHKWPADDFDTLQCRKMIIGTLDDNLYFVEKKNVVPVPIMVDDKDSKAASATAEVKTDKGHGFLTGCILLLVLAAAGTAAFFFLKKRKKESARQKTVAEKGVEMGLEVMEVVSDNLKTGLEHVRQEAGNYYVMDLQTDYKDTVVHRIYLHHSAVKKMYDFFKNALESEERTEETGCYFVGCWEYADNTHTSYNISVEDIVEPGDDIVPGEFSFNFGKKIGVKLYALISSSSQKSGRDFVHTVWMHSHPGLGLFLSSHDLQVQRQLDYSDARGRMAAFVIDTNTPDWQFAVFTAKSDGSMNNREDNPHLYSLDELYKWSRTAYSSDEMQQQASAQPEAELQKLDKYYVVPLHKSGHQNSFSLCFSGKTINQLDDILYRSFGSQKVGGWFTGGQDAQGDILLDECVTENKGDQTGLLIVDGSSAYQDILRRYQDLSDVLCVVVCRSEDELWLFARPDTRQAFGPEEEVTVSSLSFMKEWLRRRRVYK